jgi:hypothetical protein
VAFEFERGRGAILSITRDGRNLGLTLVELAQGWCLPTVPFGEGLLGYHIPLSLVVELSVERDEYGNAIALKTENGEKAAIQQVLAYHIV